LTNLPWRRYLSAVVTLFMVAAALVSLAWLVPWTYAAPPQGPGLPELDGANELFWGQGMRLLGTRLDERDLSGQEEPELALTACWRSDERPARNYGFYVHVVDQALNVLGARDTHTGLGNYPTSLWQPGDTFCDYVRVPLPNAPQPVQVADVIAGFYDPETDEPLQAYDASGAPLELAVID